MGKSKGKEIYLNRLKDKSISAKEYVEALERSPYAEHRRAAAQLKPQLEEMSRKAIEDLKAKEESAEFKKSLGL